MGNDFITRLLAGLLEAFKVKSPKAFALVAFALGIANYLLTQGAAQGIWAPTETLATVGQWLAWLLTLLVGSATVQYLPTDKKAKALEKRGLN